MKDLQKEHFETAYRTGSDIWTHIPYQTIASSMIPGAQGEPMVLDIGAGRGLWVFHLGERGYKVLGIDYVEDVVRRANQEIKSRNISDRARFVCGDALNIPFTGSSFDIATDIGTFQHIKRESWELYVREVARVLESGGYYLNVSLSRKTPQFLGWSALRNEEGGDGHFEKFGISYYFFNEDEIRDVFSSHFDIIKQKVEVFDARTDPGEKVAFVFSLLQKK